MRPPCGTPEDPRVPVLWGTDAVHGHNNIPGATIFPHNIGLGAARDPELIRRIGEITALEVRVTGLDWAFSPTVAVARDARWGRTYESYSEDPELVRQYAAAMVQGLQGVPGHRQLPGRRPRAGHARSISWATAAPRGKDQGDNLGHRAASCATSTAPATRRRSRAGAQIVMASYSSWHGLKMHGNEALLTEVLKGRFGFDGFVIGDWNGHAQLPGCSAVSCAAGGQCRARHADGPGRLAASCTTTRSRRSRPGRSPRARLDDAVRRILRVKLRAHLLTEGRPSARPYAGHYELLGSPEHRAVARQAVRESLVLLKNRNHLLPLAPRQRVLVTGDGRRQHRQAKRRLDDRLAGHRAEPGLPARGVDLCGHRAAA